MIKFTPFESHVDISFWHWLSEYKINEQALSEDIVPINAYFSCNSLELTQSSEPSLLKRPQLIIESPFISKTREAFQSDTGKSRSVSNVGVFYSNGELLNVNTKNGYKDPKYIQKVFHEIWAKKLHKSILFYLERVRCFANSCNSAPLDRTEDEILDLIGLSRSEFPNIYFFGLYTYADLKRHIFWSWLCCPALLLWSFADERVIEVEKVSAKSLADFTLVADNDQSISLVQMINSLINESKIKNGLFCLRVFPNEKLGPVSVTGALLDIYCSEQSKDINSKYIFGYFDPCNHDNSHSWSLRNLLYLLSHVKPLEVNGSVLVHVLKFKLGQQNDSLQMIDMLKLPYLKAESESLQNAKFKAVGWEKNSFGKLAPKIFDLKSIMDPISLGSSAIDLNLRLMKWRAAPQLNLDVIKKQKCLIIGAGTLGCNVARNLIGWGVTKITFVDNSEVSFSNLVRQPLYNFEDHGKPKAAMAAKNLRNIWPRLDSAALSLNIPMPGHHPYIGIKESGESMSLKQAYEILNDAISSHDIVFVALDSRESRWLPTLLCKLNGTNIIDLALGFDSFVIIRHPGNNLRHGCYFCNDIIAPLDSTTDRTLDQQCTVTRPGLASICGAVAVELLVTLLQHPEGFDAAAGNLGDVNSQTETFLGAIPHQIRGFLSHFQNIGIAGKPFKSCTACSDKVMQRLQSYGLEFLEEVLRDPKILEEISGLSALHDDMENMQISVDWESE